MPLALLILSLVVSPQSDRGGSAYSSHFVAADRFRAVREWDDAEREYRAALAWSPENPICAFYLACTAASRERIDEGLEWLERSAKWGWDDAELARGDAELAPLRGSEPFDAIVREMRRDEPHSTAPPEVRWNWRARAPSITADGMTAASGRAGLGHLWDVLSGELITALHGERGVGLVRFSPDGALAVATLNDPAARVYDSRTGAPLHPVQGYDLWASQFALSAGSSRVLAVGTSRAVVWDLADGRRVAELRGSGRARALSPDGTRAVTVHGNVPRGVVVSDVDRAREIWSSGDALSVHVSKIDFSPGGELALVAGIDLGDRSPGSVVAVYSVLDVAATTFVTEERRLTTTAEPVWTPDGKLLTIAQGGVVECVEPRTGDVAWRIESGAKWVSHAHASPSLDTLVAVVGKEGGGFLAAYDVASAELLWERAYGQRNLLGLVPINFSSAPDSVVVDDDGALLQLDVRTGRERSRMRRGSEGPVYSAVPGSNRVVIGTESGAVRTLDLGTGTVGPVLSRIGVPVEAIEVSPDARVTAVVGADGLVRLFGDGQSSTLDALDAPVEEVGLAFAPDGSRLLVWGHSLWNFTAPQEHATLWSVDDGRSLARIAPDEGEYVFACWNSSGETFATASNSGQVELWDGRTGARVGPSIEHEPSVEWLAFHPTAPLLASAGGDGHARLWSLESGELVRAFEHDDWGSDDTRVRRVLFLDDGAQLVTTSGDYGQVWSWNTATGESTWKVDGRGANPWPVHIAPAAAGRRIFVSGQRWMNAIVDAESGDSLVDLQELEVGRLDPAATGELVIGRMHQGLVVLDPERGRTLYTWVPFVGDEALVLGASGHYDGGSNVGRMAHVLLDDGTSAPLESFAPLLLDPKRARGVLAGGDVVAPRLPALPGLRVTTPVDRMSKVESRQVRLAASARADRGLLGFQLEVNGAHVELGQLQAATQFVDERREARLVFATEIPPGESEVQLRLCAVAADGTLSRPAFRTIAVE